MVTQVETIQKLQKDFLKEKTVLQNANFGSQIRWQDSVDEFSAKKLAKQRSLMAVLSDIENAKMGAMAHE